VSGPPSGSAAEVPEEKEPWRLWDHIGMISGAFLGLIAFAIVVMLALAGDPGAFAIIVVVVMGVALIFLGGKLHGPRRR
jgi:hypothetical protein